MQRKLREGGTAIHLASTEEVRLLALRAAHENVEGPVRGALPLHGNTRTYNIDDLLVNTILQSPYFRELAYVEWLVCVSECDRLSERCPRLASRVFPRQHADYVSRGRR
jgi:hypothetical protein